MEKSETAPALTLEIPIEDRFVGLVRHLAAHSARRSGLGEDRVDDVKVAVTEVVTNAVAAHRRQDLVDLVRIEFHIGSPFAVTVLNSGDEAGPVPGSIDPDDPDDDEGLGLMIAEALVDEMSTHSLSAGGRRIVLTLHPNLSDGES